MALVGVCLSMGGSVLVARRSLSDEGASPLLASKTLAIDCLRYSAPIVAANALYLGIPLINRALVTARFGFAETGQFSLSFDIGARVVAAIGSALDVLLFQIAVRADELHGPDHARDQVARNMAIVLLVLTPSCLGLWLVLPSLEQVVVPSEFRGPFGHYLTLMLPGLFCWGMMAYAINPIFQIRKSTVPLIAAAVVGCIVDAAISLVSPVGSDASGLAIAQAAALASSFLALVLFSLPTRPKWPAMRDFFAIFAASAAMVAAVFPLRAMHPGLAVLSAQIAAGGLVYAGIAYRLNAANIRTIIVEFLHERTSRPSEPSASSKVTPKRTDLDPSLAPDRLAG
jgi:hypothetical protein